VGLGIGTWGLGGGNTHHGFVVQNALDSLFYITLSEHNGQPWDLHPLGLLFYFPKKVEEMGLKNNNKI
jgi:hypothetical protein